MQTFLPYPNFSQSARVLDMKRLGKQRVETLQIMTALVLKTGWTSHPAVKMWAGYELALIRYQAAICFEWTDIRHYKDTCFDKTEAMFYDNSEITPLTKLEDPFWLGRPEFHESQQSNLVRKNQTYYGNLFPEVPDDLPYYWPR